jgi:rare lipoprotein A
MACPLKIRSLLLVGLLSILVLVAMQRVVQAEPVLTSYYGTELAGNPTASGETFDPYGLTAAHPYLPFGTMLTATLNGRSVTVRVNDRGPFVAGRGLDLSLGAAQAIGLTEAGPAVVDVEPGEAPEAKSQGTPSGTAEPPDTEATSPTQSTEPSDTESASPTQTSSSAGEPEEPLSAEEPEAGEDYSSPSDDILVPPGKRIVDPIDGGFWPRPRKGDLSYKTAPGPDEPLAPELVKEREQKAPDLYARLRGLRRRNGELGEEDIL